MVAMAPTTARSNVGFSLVVPFQVSQKIMSLRPYVAFSKKNKFIYLKMYLLLFGDREFASSSGIYSEFVKKYCLKNAQLAILCHNIRFSTFGHDYGNMNPVC